ncbi:hypothetical protein EVAR_8495_1 [Eumeta japonica]|uniref:Uncharacterized protein n=1 Tax=Eumeta variegata TaxID=151549 RepID=A0A4C1XJM0_EUMVA|nr:hypothetical protein EVAR_8495_1 [Eumeta japonica]
MSIPHTLAPVRSGDESGDRSDDFYSFTERGRTAHVSADGVTCYGRHLKGVAGIDVTGNRHGTVPVPPAGRERSAAARWVKWGELRSMT